MHNCIKCGAVVFNIQPVTDILAVAVYGKLFTCKGIVDDQGDKLLRELPRTVVVGAVGSQYGKPVCMVPGADKMVRRCL